MPTLDEVKDQIDGIIDNLPPEDKIAVGNYVIQKGIVVKKAEELTEAISLHPSKNIIKEYLLWQESLEVTENSTETHTETFCGVAIEQLTMSQKKLYRKLTEDQRKDMSQKVSINTREDETGWYIQFLKLQWNNAIAGKEIATNVNKDEVEATVQNLRNGWELARDIDSIDTNTNILQLDPVNSDYDAMILQMPGSNNNEKEKNFRLLTGMNWSYRTISELTIRRFIGNGQLRSYYGTISYWHVRPVKSV